jgi:hypothetical protein
VGHVRAQAQAGAGGDRLVEALGGDEVGDADPQVVDRTVAVLRAVVEASALLPSGSRRKAP